MMSQGHIGSKAVYMWSPDPDVGRDVLQLVQCLRLVSDAVSGEMAYEMEKALEYLESPEQAAELILENMLCNDKSVTMSPSPVLMTSPVMGN